ncbi:12882_t:CDS:2 [Dentiscutata heterogama]|uniref:12882_t:CDS:1 n=1 Tax=Dentiscutata heterogama TaxID=1316150 RepID=A0ACA9K3G2_9GLOM|nr:12882_t:CDS:2 [Dentiscutata heterogama]
MATIITTIKYYLCVPLNIISLISTIILCVTFSLIRIYYPNLADRVSFRLAFAASFCDVGYSGHLLAFFFWDTIPDFLCGYLTWAIVFFNLSSLFFIVCITMNLHIIFINEYKSRYTFEKYYFIIALSFALLLSLLPIAANMFDNDGLECGCLYHYLGQEKNLIWQWITFFGWIYASILYCMIVVIMVIKKLKSVKKEVDDVFGSLPNSQLAGYSTKITKSVISFVVRRVMWYPVVPLVAQFFGSLIETYAYVNRAVPYPLILLSYIGLSLQGLMNTLVFSQDIAVTRAFQVAKLHWWISYVNYYESHYSHRSYNKAITEKFNMLGISNNFVDLKILNSIDINNDNLVSQPSLLEWLRYMLLIKLFSAPKTSSRLFSHSLLSPVNSFSENKINTSFTLFGNDNLKQAITHDNQNDQDIYLALPEPVHLKDSSQYSSDLLSYHLNLSISPDSLKDSYSLTNQTITSNMNVSHNSVTNMSTYTVGDDEGRIDVMFANDESTDIDLFKEIDMFKLILKRL